MANDCCSVTTLMPAKRNFNSTSVCRALCVNPKAAALSGRSAVAVGAVTAVVVAKAEHSTGQGPTQVNPVPTPHTCPTCTAN
jgi:hypothetical protein